MLNITTDRFSNYTKQKKKQNNEQVDQQLDEVVEAIA
jgi:hypothetical protein